ncbi:anti-CRISPR protein AcrIIA2 [Listeria sp. FSL L7-1435]|uniref:anti-CRISPR protein AcrIIA2 n=1 Tax=Listeria cossartiae TaxID=2838249 RepID=UPI0016248550|nr:anti-CRISPR protein AcrIIA2 [Listeria cossartiae]MBC1548301.1 anti-CRISPR protein AcrIIA2 [Listeria cossartiae subsp. cossartiae]MBC1548791.1 anti-CRISPR protein AcrIIA2 [Listeria cossartiae subsp. cossartiae]
MVQFPAQRRYAEAMHEFINMVDDFEESTPDFAKEVLHDSDYVVVTKNEKYAVDLCTLSTDECEYDTNLYLDEKLVDYSTVDVNGVTYYINIVETNDIDDLEIATDEDEMKSDNQEIILKRELN